MFSSVASTAILHALLLQRAVLRKAGISGSNSNECCFHLRSETSIYITFTLLMSITSSITFATSFTDTPNTKCKNLTCFSALWSVSSSRSDIGKQTD